MWWSDSAQITSFRWDLFSIDLLNFLHHRKAHFYQPAVLLHMFWSSCVDYFIGSLFNPKFQQKIRINLLECGLKEHTCSMMTSSNGNIFRVTGPLCGEFTGPGEFPTQRPVTQSFDVFFDLRLNKRLSKQPWGWWFDTPSWSLWRHCDALKYFEQCIGCQHDTETFSALLFLNGGNPSISNGFPSQRVYDMELWCFLGCWPNKLLNK